MKTSSRGSILTVFVIPLGILILAVAAMAGLFALKSKPPQEDREIRPPLVEISEVVKEDVTLTVRTQGTVLPRTETELKSEVSGQILAVSDSLRDGGRFSQGDILLEIDPSDYKAAVAQAEASVAQMRVRLEQELAQAEQAAQDWNDLGRGEASSLALREPQVAEARALVLSAEAALERARRDLERTRIKAPYDGIVRSKIADLGQYVSPGTPLASIFATDYVEIRLPLTMVDLGHLDVPLNFSSYESGNEGPAVTLTADLAGRTHVWEGTISRLVGTLDERNRVTYAVAKVSDPYNRSEQRWTQPLAVGLFVEAEIEGRDLHEVAVLPRYALRADQRILIVKADNTVEQRAVQVARADSRHVYITGGLEAGERVCLTALEFVIDGMTVEALGDEADGDEKSDAEGDEALAEEGEEGDPALVKKNDNESEEI